jgi:hypothetical protein
MGFFLYVLSWVLEPFLVVINFITVIALNIRKRSFFSITSGFFKTGAIDRDRFGNHNYRTSLNFFLIKKAGYKFGNTLETISSVLGKNQRDGTLTWFGWFTVYFLWIVDYGAWFKGGHCIDSINKNVN